MADLAGIIHDLGGELPIAHGVGFTVLARISEGLASKGFKIWLVSRSYLEPELIVGNDGKYPSVLVEAISAKHGTSSDIGEMSE